MGVYTAQILVGCGKTYDKGINPSHALFLYEEDTDVFWVIKELNLTSDPLKNKSDNKKQFTPSPDNLMDDAMLLIAMYVLEDSVVGTLAKELGKTKSTDDLDLKDGFTSQDKQVLYDLVMAISVEYTLSITVFESSLLKWQLSALEKYSCERYIFFEQGDTIDAVK